MATLPCGDRVRVVRQFGFDGFFVSYTGPCSGCYEPESGCCQRDKNTGRSIGVGCTDCGHTGKRRERHWQPFDVDAFGTAMRAIEDGDDGRQL